MFRIEEIRTSIGWVIREVFVIYLFWILLHWISSNLYIKFCTTNTLWGLLMSPFRATLPHCTALRWVIFNGGKMIEVMWILLGKWFIEQLIFYKLYNHNNL
jgi:hypothetical protein